MKIIEALKKIQDLMRKCGDLQNKIKENCCIMSFENEKYEKQKTKIEGWLQSHHDILMEIEQLRLRIAKTNIVTMVTIDVGNKEVTKPIQCWISRKRDLCTLDLQAWLKLTDRGLNDQKTRSSTGDIIEFNVVRFFDPDERDKKVDSLKSELSLIDGKLEIVNAVTNLID